MADDINLGIGFDVSGAEGDESEIEKQIDELDGKTVNVKVDADTKSAEKKIDALSGKSVKVDPVKPEVEQPDPVTVKVNTPTVRPKVEMPKETSFDALLGIADATGDINRFQKKLFDLRGSIPIDVIVNCNAALADMRRELAGGAPDSEKLQRSNEALAESLRNIGVGNLEKIGTAYSNLGASIRNIDALTENKGEEIEQKVAATRDSLLAAAKQLSERAAAEGTAEANLVKQSVDDMIRALSSGKDISQQTMDLLGNGFQKVLDKSGKLSPGAMVRLGKDIQKVLHGTQEFAELVEETTGIDFKVSVSGSEKLDTLNKKIEIVQSAKDLDDGIKGLEAAMNDLDPKNAREAADIISNLKTLMTKELNDKNLKAINAEIERFGKLQSRMSSREIAKFGPQIQSVQQSFKELGAKVNPIREELKGLFDAGSMSAAVLSGNVEGVAQGLVGLAAGAFKTAGAMMALMNSFAIGIIITGIMQIIKVIGAMYGEWVKVKKEMERLPLENAKQTIEEINRNLEYQLDVLERINDTKKRGIDIDLEQAKAIREAEKAQADLNKTRALAGARTEGDRFQIEQRAKEEDDARNYADNIESLGAELAKKQEDIKRSSAELERLKEAQRKLRDVSTSLTTGMGEEDKDTYIDRASDMIGLTENEKNTLDEAEIRNRINEELEKNRKRIADLEGARSGGKKIGNGEIDLLNKEADNIRRRMEVLNSQKAVIDSENRLARTQENRRIHMEKIQRDEQESREEYDRNEQERQFKRRQSQAENGYGANLQDARDETEHWRKEESGENETVQRIRNKYRSTMTEKDQAEYEKLRKKDASLDVDIGSADNEDERAKKLEEQTAVRDRIAELESKYFKEMEEEDRFRLQNALNYRSAARNNYMAALEAEADIQRERRRSEEERIHAEAYEDNNYLIEREKEESGFGGKKSILERELARATAEYMDAYGKLQNDANGLIKLTKDEEIILKRQRDEARQRIVAIRSELDSAVIERRREDEARQHGYDLEDEAFRRESKLKRQGSYGQEAMQTAELERGTREFKEAVDKLNDAASGKTTISRDEEIRLERQRDEARQRITTARSALDDIRLGREDRRAEFDANVRRGSNRLTAMGLGSGDVSFGKDVANNTKRLVELTKEMLTTFRGQRSEFASRRTSGGIRWQ